MDPLPKNNYRDFSQLAKEAARVEIPEWDMPFNETEVGYHALLKKKRTYTIYVLQFADIAKLNPDKWN